MRPFKKGVGWAFGVAYAVLSVTLVLFPPWINRVPGHPDMSRSARHWIRWEEDEFDRHLDLLAGYQGWTIHYALLAVELVALALAIFFILWRIYQLGNCAGRIHSTEETDLRTLKRTSGGGS